MNKPLLVLLVIAWAGAGFGQPNPDTLWTRTYGGSYHDRAHSVQQTADGGYIVAGPTQSFGAGNYDFYLVKTNSLGDTLWTRTYGGSSEDWPVSVQQTTDGGYIAAGYTYSFGAGSRDFYLVKTNNIGDTLWTHTYGGTDVDGAWFVQQTADEGYIVAGYTYSFDVGGGDCYLVKTNSQGDTLWTHTYGGTIYDDAHCVQQTADGGYIALGTTTSYGAGWYDFYLVRTTSLGAPLWSRTYGGSNEDWGNFVRQTTDGGYIVVGGSRSFGTGSFDSYLVKTNSLGDTLWTRIYGGGPDDAANSVQQTADGGYIAAGYTNSFGVGTPTYNNFYLIKTNSQGDTLWTRTYGGSRNDWANSVQQTAEGGYIVAGSTFSFGVDAPTYSNMYLVKTGSDGLETPRGLVILVDDGNAVLSWPPTGAPSYNIYGAVEPFVSGSLLDTVSDTTWTDSNTSGRPSPYFYYVMAAAP